MSLAGRKKLVEGSMPTDGLRIVQANNWGDVFKKYENNVKGSTHTIKETQTISYTRDSGSDSVNTAEYIRSSRRKGNKNIPGNSIKCLIKKYCYVKETEWNYKPAYTSGARSRNRKFVDIPIENNARKKRVYRKKRKSRPLRPRSYSTSSDNVSCERTKYNNKYRRSTITKINNKNEHSTHRTYGRQDSASSVDTANCSDPEDLILENVRKIYKNTMTTSQSNVANTLGSGQIAQIINQKMSTESDASRLCNSKTLVNSVDEDILFMSREKRLRLNGKCLDDKPELHMPSEYGQSASSEEDIIFMSREKRLRLFGKHPDDELTRNISGRLEKSSSSDDDLLFKSHGKRLLIEKSFIDKPLRFQLRDMISSTTDDELFKIRH